MKLTKEECEYRLSQLKRVKCHIADEVSIAGKIELDNGIENYEALFNEHFNNPPLKFEELKEGMPIWDSVKKCWIYIVHIARDYSNKLFTYVWWFDKNNDYYTESLVEFEENRFYRKEVKETTPLKQSNNELNAETMFKKLGFILDSKEPLTYRKDDGGYITEYMFNPLIKRVQISEWEEYNNNLPQGSTSLHIDHMEAINQQMIELGWI